MGFLGSDTLNRTTLQGWIDKYDLNTFIETGLQRGKSLSFMMSLDNVEKYISIEINYNYIEEAKLRGLEQRETANFGSSSEERKPLDDRVLLLHGSSVDMLPAAMEAAEGNVLWWLDAHLPHQNDQWADRKPSKEDILERSVAFPLEKELDIMIASRDISNDVILCDDLQAYSDGGNKRFARRGYGHLGSPDFIQRALEPTHITSKVEACTGYLIALPREKKG